MAQENEQLTNDDGEIVKASGSKLALITLVLATRLVIVTSIGCTLYLLGLFDAEEVLSEEDLAVEIDNMMPRPAIYFPIKPAFTINFPSRGRQRYLQVDMTALNL
jgi:flagellar FliL protein